MRHPNLDTFSLENTLRTDPNAIYEAFVSILSRQNPTFRWQIEFLLRKGYPMSAMRAILCATFQPATSEIILKALIWKRNMLIVGEAYFFNEGPSRNQ